MKKFLLIILVSVATSSFAQNNVVISQVYGGGGLDGSAYRNDFIELYNPTNNDISLNNWSVQFASLNGGFISKANLSGIIGSGRYLLIEGASNGSSGTILPPPDAVGAINLSSLNGRIALVNSQNLLNTNCPTSPSIVDFVGFGSTSCAEGSTAPALSKSKAIARNLNNADTDNNATDFTSILLTPRNAEFGILSTTLQNFDAKKLNSGVNLHWLVGCLNNSVTFELQKSNTTNNFITFHQSTETKLRCAAPFDFVDASITSGPQYYRLKIIDLNGRVKFSKIELINTNSLKDKLSIFPTIVTANADVYYVADRDGIVNWVITDMQGRIVKNMNSKVVNGTNKIVIPLPTLISGQYSVKGISSIGNTNAVRFMKQ